MTEKKQEIFLKNDIKFNFINANIYCEFTIPKKVIPMVKPVDVFGVIGISDGEGHITYFKSIEAVERFTTEYDEGDCYYGSVITFQTYEGSKIDLEAVHNEEEF